MKFLSNLLYFTAFFTEVTYAYEFDVLGTDEQRLRMIGATASRAFAK